jgi:hypothetical protein
LAAWWHVSSSYCASAATVGTAGMSVCGQHCWCQLLHICMHACMHTCCLSVQHMTGLVVRLVLRFTPAYVCAVQLPVCSRSPGPSRRAAGHATSPLSWLACTGRSLALARCAVCSCTMHYTCIVIQETFIYLDVLSKELVQGLRK